MVKKLVITGCTEALLLAITAMVSPQFLHDNAVWIALGAMLILLSVALYDWVKGRGAKGETPAVSASDHGSAAGGDIGYIINQTHSGSGPNIGRVDQLNLGRRELELTPALLGEIERLVHTEGGGKKVVVMPSGSHPKSFDIARAVTEHLRKNGVEVDDDRHMAMRSPPQSHAVEITQREDGGLTIEIDASIGP